MVLRPCYELLKEGEEAWLMMGKRAPPSPSSRSDMHLSDDVPAVSLADPDSRFIECCGLSVHYKEAFPLVRSPLSAMQASHLLCIAIVVLIESSHCALFLLPCQKHCAQAVTCEHSRAPR